MEKHSLLTWRRREKKFPDTKAQRRARAREQRPIDEPIYLDVEELNALDLLVTSPYHNADGEQFLGTRALAHFLVEENIQAQSPQASPASAIDQLTLTLTDEQNRALRTLLFCPQYSENESSRHLFQLEKKEDHQGVKLYFSLCSQQIPEMISLKELCSQLKVGRRAVMRLIHHHGLRYYRIAQRYRFSVKDVQDFLYKNSNIS